MNRQITIDFGRCIRVLISKLWLIAIAGLVFFGAAYMLTQNPGVDIYQATATVYSSSYGSYQTSVEGISAMRMYQSVVTSLKVAQRAERLLNDEALTAESIQAMVSVSSDSNSSSVMSISANSPNRDRAVRVANAVAASFVLEMQNVTGESNVQMLDEANTAMLFYSTGSNFKKYRLGAALGGAALVSLIVLLAEIFSARVKSENDATLGGDLELLGFLPEYSKPSNSKKRSK